MTPPRPTTPMMEQYLGVKAKYPDTLLLYRMGDFYETFYQDAVTLSGVLGIALTSRSQGDAERIPLAGIPWHSAEPQIARLLRAGLKIAICEQVESPAEAKGLIARRVVEVLSPGTAVTDPLLEGNRNNFLAALCGADEQSPGGSRPFDGRLSGGRPLRGGGGGGADAPGSIGDPLA